MTDHNAAALLAQLAALGKTRPSEVPHERRQYRRFEVRAEADLYPMDRRAPHSHPVAALIRDIGQCGAGLIATADLPLDSTWRMAVLNRQLVIAQLPIIIRHSRKLGDAAWLINTQFCIESGLLSMLGINPTAICEGHLPGPEELQGEFLAPDELTP
jgi:hypothetical protein